MMADTAIRPIVPQFNRAGLILRIAYAAAALLFSSC